MIIPIFIRLTVQVPSTVGKVSFWNKDESLYDNVWQASCSLGATYDGTNNLFTLTESTLHNDRNSNIYGGTWSTYGSTEPTDNTYYICGANGLTGYEWDSTEEAIAASKLEYDSATSTYTKTYKNIPKGDYEFKVRDAKNNDSWFGYDNYTITTSGCTVSKPNNSDNIILSLTETLDVTISITSDNKKLTVTAGKDVQTYTITTETAVNGTVTTSATSLVAGKTFTVTAIPDNGYELDAITVKNANSYAINPNSDGFYTMPASNVTVSATFKVKTDAKYSVTYTAPTGEGVASASINPKDATLAAGTPVTVTVNDGYTASLAVGGVDVTTSTSGNTYTFTFSMPAQAITVAPKVAKAGENTGTMIPNLYLIYGNESNNPSTYTIYTKLYVDSSNQVFAYFTNGDNLNTAKQYYFLISTSYGADSYTKAYNNPNNRAFNDTKYNDVVTTGQEVYNIGNTTYY